LEDVVGQFIFGYPWWLMVAVLVVFAALLWHALGGRVQPTQRLPLAVVLAPACVLAVVVVATALSSALSGPYEPPIQTTPERRAPPRRHPFL
jgi:Kef-type K+ transport system membrane component KefB